MRKAKKIVMKRRVKVDMSEWETGDWSEELENSVTIKVGPDGKQKTITLDDIAQLEVSVDFEKATKKIAAEVIAAFFDSWGVVVRLGPEGIIIEADELEESIILPLGVATFTVDGLEEDKKTAAIWRKHIDDLEKERLEEYADGEHKPK